MRGGRAKGGLVGLLMAWACLCAGAQTVSDEDRAYWHTADSMAVEGARLADRGMVPEALTELLRAVEILDAHNGSRTLIKKGILTHLANLYSVIGRYDKVLEYGQLSVDLNKEQGGKRDHIYAVTMGNLALAAYHQGDGAKALEYVGQKILLGRRFSGMFPTIQFTGLLDKAYYLAGLGRYEEAAAELDKAEEVLVTLPEQDYGENFSKLLMQRADLAGARGDHGAEKELQAQAREAVLGNSVLLARQMAWEAGRLFGTDDEKALAMALRVLAMDDVPLDVATRMHSYASTLCFVKGDYAAAEPHARWVVDVSRSRKVTDTENYEKAALALSNILILQARYGDAFDFMKSVEPDFIIFYGEESKEYATLMSNYCVCLQALGEYDSALVCGLLALAIRENLPDVDDDVVAASYQNLIDIYLHNGDYDKAHDLAVKNVEIRERPENRGNRLRLAQAYSMLAVALSRNDRFDESLACLDKAREAYALSQYVHPEFLFTLRNNYLMNYLSMGDDTKAREYAASLYGMVESGELDMRDVKYPVMLSNLAMSFIRFNNSDNALELLTRAERYLRELNPVHPMLATVYINMGLAHSLAGNDLGAFEATQKSVDILEESGMTETDEYALALGNLGLYLSEADPSSSLEVLLKVVEADELRGRTQRAAHALMLGNIGQIYAAGNEEAKGFGYMERAIGLYRNLSITRTESYRTTLSNYALFLILYGREKDFLAVARELAGLCTADLHSSFPLLTESERLRYWEESLADWYRTVMPVGLRYADDAAYRRIAFDAQLQGRGVLLASTKALADLIASSGDEEAKELYETLRAKQKSLYSDTSTLTDDELRALEKEVDGLEHRLMARSKVFGDFMSEFTIDTDDVAAALADDDLVVEFVVCGGNDRKGEGPAYGALTLRKSYSAPRFTLLCDADSLESFAGGNPYADERVSRMLLAPLREELKGVRRVFFTPDGVINNLAIEAMPVYDNPAEVMSDRWEMYRLSSSRSLVRGKTVPAAGSAVVYGGISFDASPSELEADSRRYVVEKNVGTQKVDDAGICVAPRRAMRLTGREAGGGVDSLPGTRREAIDISRLLSDRGINVRFLHDSSATEASFKNLSGKKTDIIHVATHGFYFDPDSDEEIADQGGIMACLSSSRHAENIILSRSGLLFAGGGNALDGVETPSGVDNGILTAMEVADLDLSDTGLVVLSACETGLGLVAPDGVFGLQRGLKKAGAGSVLMSLQKVDDDATRELMTLFYANLTSRPEEGIHKAFDTARRQMRASGGRFSSPSAWAPFILLDALP